MAAQSLETLDVRSRQDWRKWLEEHFDSVSEIWLVFHKQHTGVTCVPLEPEYTSGFTST
jgi:hypothetical protein